MLERKRLKTVSHSALLPWCFQHIYICSASVGAGVQVRTYFAAFASVFLCLPVVCTMFIDILQSECAEHIGPFFCWAYAAMCVPSTNVQVDTQMLLVACEASFGSYLKQKLLVIIMHVCCCPILQTTQFLVSVCQCQHLCSCNRDSAHTVGRQIKL